ncbi:MAG: hypothetical protein GYA51_12295 [Candidatus Methanofastidiosa archaeon]|nr:hypothetical protein [Candidatus Methanofastidiosa archaeon]
MKRIVVRSHQAEKPIVLPSGDAYDSLAILEDEKISMIILMNVDSGVLRKDGKIEIANGTYQIICENHQRLGKCLRVLTQKGSGILPTIQENPRHKNKKIASGILIHKGGLRTDNSEGCLTIPPNNYDKFISHWDIGEKGVLIKL